MDKKEINAPTDGSFPIAPPEPDPETGELPDEIPPQDLEIEPPERRCGYLTSPRIKSRWVDHIDMINADFEDQYGVGGGGKGKNNKKASSVLELGKRSSADKKKSKADEKKKVEIARHTALTVGDIERFINVLLLLHGSNAGQTGESVSTRKELCRLVFGTFVLHMKAVVLMKDDGSVAKLDDPESQERAKEAGQWDWMEQSRFPQKWLNGAHGYFCIEDAYAKETPPKFKTLEEENKMVDLINKDLLSGMGLQLIAYAPPAMARLMAGAMSGGEHGTDDDPGALHQPRQAVMLSPTALCDNMSRLLEVAFTHKKKHLIGSGNPDGQNVEVSSVLEGRSSSSKRKKSSASVSVLEELGTSEDANDDIQDDLLDVDQANDMEDRFQHHAGATKYFGHDRTDEGVDIPYIYSGGPSSYRRNREDTQDLSRELSSTEYIIDHYCHYCCCIVIATVAATTSYCYCCCYGTDQAE